MPRLVVLAGPNGAGKTTFAKRMFSAEIAAGQYLNADEEAAAINPTSVDEAALRAGRNMLKRRRSFVAAGRDMIVETTLSGRTLMRDLQAARGMGYRFELHFLFAPTVELCVERVLFRVQRGGHGIPSAVIGRRYVRGLQLLPSYLEVADSYALWDISSAPKLIATKDGGPPAILDPGAYQRFDAKMKMLSTNSP